MAITVRNPNRIFLGGDPRPTLVNEYAAKEAITPGMLCDLDSTGGVNRWKKAATAKAPTTSVANDMPMLNKGIDDACAANDLIEVLELVPGHKFLGLIGSGAAISFGDKLENAGNGKFRAWTDAAQAFRALEALSPLADAHIRMEVL